MLSAKRELGGMFFAAPNLFDTFDSAQGTRALYFNGSLRIETWQPASGCKVRRPLFIPDTAAPRATEFDSENHPALQVVENTG